MRYCKRAFALLLFFVVLLGNLPGMPAPLDVGIRAAGEPLKGLNEACVKVNTGETISWKKFVENMISYTSAKLVSDVVFLSSDKLEATDKSQFQGYFSNPDGHTITIENNFRLEPNSRGDAGLFPQVTHGGTVEGLVVKVKGRVCLTSPDAQRPLLSGGLLVGQLNGSTLRDSAIIISEQAAVLEARNGLVTGDSYVGGLVGYAQNSTIHGCFSDISVSAAFGGFQNDKDLFYTAAGGLVGRINGSSTRLQNCAYYGRSVTGYAAEPRRSFDSRNLLAAGMFVGHLLENASIANCYSEGGFVRILDIQEANHPNLTDILRNESTALNSLKTTMASSQLGMVAGNTNSNYTNVYASCLCIYDPEDNWLWEQNVLPPNTATAKKLGEDYWVAVNEKYLNLKWLIKDSPTVTVNGNWPPTVSITPYPLSGNAWEFGAEVPRRGKMPTAGLPESLVLDSGNPTQNYTLKFKPFTVDGVDVRDLYQYKFVKSLTDRADDANVKADGADNYNTETGIKFHLENPDGVEKVYLQVIVKGNARLEESAWIIYTIPLKTWGEGYQFEWKVPGNGEATPRNPDTVTAKGVKYEADAAVGGVANSAMNLIAIEYQTADGSTVCLTETTLGKGDIKITNVEMQKPPYDAYHSVYFVSTGSGGGTSSDRTSMPVIRPGVGEIINEQEGITITVSGESNYKIFYTTSKTENPPLDPDPDDEKQLYTKAIPFPLDSEVFIVKAMALVQGKTASSVAQVRYTRKDNLADPAPPELKLGTASFEPDVTYAPGSEIHFTHARLTEGTVYFTLDGRTPTEGIAEQYDQDKPLSLPGGRQAVTVQAFYRHKTSLKESAIKSFRVQVRQPIGGPAASIPSNTSVGNGTPLLFTLSDKALAQLDLNYRTSNAFLRRVVYRDGSDQAFPEGLYENGVRLTDPFMQDASNNNVTIRLDPGSETPVDGMEYINCVADEDAFIPPELRYLLGDGDPVKEGSGYGYSLRMVTRTAGTPDAYTVRYRNAPEIQLTGNPRDKIHVRGAVLTPNAFYEDSAVTDFFYMLRDRVQAPTAFPATTADKPASVRPDQVIRLTTKTSGTKIYYTLDNSTPSVDSAGNPAGSTLLYDETAGIPMNKDAVTFMTIRAVAWANGLDISEPAMFVYQLPATVQPVLAAPNGGEVVEGTEATLSTTTDKAVIYYTTDGGEVEVGKSPIYKNPIVINEDMTIRAVAEKEGMTSSETEYEFEVAGKLKAPKASLTSGSVVYKGARIKLEGRENIAYTVDGSDPTVILKTDDASSSSAGGTNITVTTGEKAKEDQVLYGENVVIDADFGKSVTVRAFCYGNGHTPSDVASFTYTVCEEDAYLTAIPEPGGTVSPGTAVTMTTSLTDGQVYYTTGGDTPAVDEDGEYRWVARGDTLQGNTVTVEGAPGGAFTIRALAVQDGAEGGTPVVLTYKIAERTPAPTASIPSGAITLDGASVTLTVQEGDIFYTTDGADPTTSSTLYTGPIPVNSSMILKAIAVAKDKEPSEIVQYVYTRAGDTAAPVMSVPGGEIEQGARVEITTSTLGAVIYYTTDGTEPGEQSMTYTSPVTVMRPVTIRAKAVKAGLHDSVVNSATYTVFEPVKPEAEASEDKLQRLETDRLATRRTYSDEDAGPTFSDVLLVDPQYNAVFSAPEGNAPKDAQLIIHPVEPTEQERQAVKVQTQYHIISAYDIRLERDGEEVQPSGESEIGLPIPPEYQNGVVVICWLADDGTVELLDTRRSGGFAYAMRDHLSRYAITVPQTAAATAVSSKLPWIAGGVTVLCGGAGAVLSAVYLRKKRKTKA